jgi:energy-coupling factor transporter ATP-binding protein EcfA2
MTPKIEIKGSSASGKSSLAWMIKGALEMHEIKCEVTGCEDEDPGVLNASWQRRIKSLKGKTVTIETVRTSSVSETQKQKS